MFSSFYISLYQIKINYLKLLFLNNINGLDKIGIKTNKRHNSVVL